MLDGVLYRTGRDLADVYGWSMVEMDVECRAPMPLGAKILAANHPTTTDPFLLLSLLPEQVSILITETVFKIPVLGRYLRLAGHIPVVEGNGRTAFEEARRLLEAGRTIGIFPEGALSPLDGGFCRPHTGAARLALSAGAPVIPVGIHVQREHVQFVETEVDGHTEVARWYRDGPYAVTVGEPLRFEGNVEDRAGVVALTERLMQRVGQLSQESARRMAARLNSGTSTLPRTATLFDVGRAVLRGA